MHMFNRLSNILIIRSDIQNEIAILWSQPSVKCHSPGPSDCLFTESDTDRSIYTTNLGGGGYTLVFYAKQIHCNLLNSTFIFRSTNE